MRPGPVADEHGRNGLMRDFVHRAAVDYLQEAVMAIRADSPAHHGDYLKAALHILKNHNITLSAIRLSRSIQARGWAPGLGLVLAVGSWVVLMEYLWRHDSESLIQIGPFSGVVMAAELLFSWRSL